MLSNILGLAIGYPLFIAVLLLGAKFIECFLYAIGRSLWEVERWLLSLLRRL